MEAASQPSSPGTTPSSQASIGLHTNALLEMFIPGYSIFDAALKRYFLIDISIYIPILLLFGLLSFVWNYVQNYFNSITDFFTCQADIRQDDEMYNILMHWVASQKFSNRSRRFVASTNLNSRSWFLYDYNHIDEDEDRDGISGAQGSSSRKDKAIYCAPSVGVHYFWYKNSLCWFSRIVNNDRQNLALSEREETSVSCIGRNPAPLRDLLNDMRLEFIKSDEDKTIIYRAQISGAADDASWSRCMSRLARPFATVVLDEQIKSNLIRDLEDYIHPATKRWYANRGIPYRRGYLLHGPPGTGKSSLSFAIAGYFKLKIYTCSLNSPKMTEESLGALFNDSPRSCIVLLEDIDTAGLTHTRETPTEVDQTKKPTISSALPDAVKKEPEQPRGRLSLSALLNVIDGVASQEGRILIMTTNHIDKLDPALIRPGRVDMKVGFTLATTLQTQQIFRNLFSYQASDHPSVLETTKGDHDAMPVKNSKVGIVLDEKEKAILARLAAKQEADNEKIDSLAEEFARLVPTTTFSPAELQGYLLRHKHDPRGAVEDATAWVEEMNVQRTRDKAKKEEEEKQRIAKEAAEQEEKERIVTTDTKEATMHTHVVKDSPELTAEATKGMNGNSTTACACKIKKVGVVITNGIHDTKGHERKDSKLDEGL